jgi:hypothetical protein
MVLFLLAGVFAIWLVIRQKKNLVKLTFGLNLISVVLVLMPVIQGSIYLNRAKQNEVNQITRTAQSAAQRVGQTDLPDIYYLVLDSYARHDLLQKTYLYDNSKFLKYLQDMGFYIAECSQSNYNHTWLSIPSALNMEYMPDRSNSGDKNLPIPTAKHTVVRTILEQMGYKTVAFDTGYDFINLTDARYYLTAGENKNIKSLTLAPINTFELMFLRTTLITARLELKGISEDQIELQVKRDLMEYMYLHLPDVPDIKEPKFVYAHISTTHPPFIYSFTDKQRREEEKTDPELASLGAQTRLYRESVAITDEKMIPILDAIFEKSKNPPIIIIQGDHGPFLKNSEDKIFNILNAYYFPDQDYQNLYQDISPVNSFGIVLNHLFGTSYKLKEDRHFYSSVSAPDEFKEYPGSCNP